MCDIEASIITNVILTRLLIAIILFDLLRPLDYVGVVVSSLTCGFGGRVRLFRNSQISSPWPPVLIVSWQRAFHCGLGFGRSCRLISCPAGTGCCSKTVQLDCSFMDYVLIHTLCGVVPCWVTFQDLEYKLYRYKLNIHMQMLCCFLVDPRAHCNRHWQRLKRCMGMTRGSS